MWHLCLVLLLQATGAQPAGPGAPAKPESQPTTTAPTYNNGPMRCEPVAMFDARYWYLDPANTRPSELQMRWRISGERLGDIARFGNIIFTEAADDTGKALIGPETYTEEDRTTTRPLKMTADGLAAGGLMLSCRLDAPSRAARTLKLRGSVHLVLATGRQEVTIDNPLQYVGKPLANEHLQKLAIRVEMVPPDQLEPGEQPAPPAQRSIVLKYVEGRERVQTVSIYDAWMKRIMLTERPMQTKDGAAVTVYTISTGELNEDSQLVLEAFQRTEDVQLPLDVPSQPLP